MTTSVITTPTGTAAHPGWRRAAGVAALGAPLAELLAVVVGVEHTSDVDRQLDIIAAHTGRFTAMNLLEMVCYTLAAVTAAAVALRISSGRGSRFAAAGAVLTVVGAVANLNGFGGPLPTLVKHDPQTARYFVDHLGPIYQATVPLTGLLYLGLLAMFVGLWRSGRVAWPWLAVSAVALVASAAMGGGRAENTVAMVLLTAGFVGIARFLAGTGSTGAAA
jgi:hypothetical protein